MTGPRLSILLLCLALGACTSRPAQDATTGHRDGTPAFGRMSAVLQRGAAARERADATALRALEPGLSVAGLDLLRARMPHDLRRSDVGLFLEARAAFGDALKQWVGALQDGPDTAVLAGYDAVAETYRAWLGVYRGLAPERAV